MDIHDLLARSLLYGVLPAWLVAGFLDYICHRRTNIELTSGMGEARLHVIQYLQIVVATGIALCLEINALALLLLCALVLAHSIAGIVDVSYTDSRRRISPLEQHVHSWMETLPVFALLVVLVLHWDALAGELQFVFAGKREPVPHYAILATAVGLALAGGAVIEEFVRTARTAARRAEQSPARRRPPV
jgi:ABC-type amino acid transport system permease subunit